MSRREIYDCDFCDNKDMIIHNRIYFPVGYQFGGPGGSEEILEPKDLCPRCLKKITQHLVNLLSFDYNQDLISKKANWRSYDRTPIKFKEEIKERICGL